ncbi:MAG: peroxiredoxin [Burkholderiales bacterium]|nr:peroxiredoxin [Burkholderiales bacterium]
MLSVGKKFPEFQLTAVNGVTEDSFSQVNLETYGKDWKIIFFWPKDFTFVCPTEIAGFGKLEGDFKDRDAVLIGASTDSDFVHAAWRGSHNDLKPLTFPWLADIKKELTTSLGILNEDAGVANRATFIVDPDNIIRYAEMTDMSVGRNPTETLRILDALQTDELCPCNWNKGDATL